MLLDIPKSQHLLKRPTINIIVMHWCMVVISAMPACKNK